MTDHPIEIAAAVAIGGVIAVITWLLSTPSTVELPQAPPPVKPSLKLTRKQLLLLAREHQIKNARWRARATKIEFVRELQREVANG